MSTTSSRNFTTLYSGAGSVVPQGAYGNANVVSLLNEGTDGANTVANIVATGTVTAGYFAGDGSQLTNITAGNISGNVNFANTAGTAQFVTGNAQANITSVGTLTSLSVTGNVTGGNLLTAGAVSAASVSATGNVTGGNLLTGGVVSATGNISTQGFFIGTFLGNIVGNLIVPGANTQVLYNNNGNADASAGFTFNSASNVVTVAGNIVGANVSTVGNITGNYILGNGSQLTGLGATYGNANVAANLAAFATNPISTSGNITAGYFLGNGSQLTGIGSSYGNAEVAANLAAFATNPISTSGNITAGYFFGNGSGLTDITAANIVGAYGNANVANFLGNGFGSNTITTTGNITTGNVTVPINGRYYGDFTSGITAGRTAFQTTNTGNSAGTFIAVIPGANHVTSNTAINSSFNLFASGDVGNSAIGTLRQFGNLTTLQATNTGTATAGNIRIVAGASQINLLTTGNVSISTDLLANTIYDNGAGNIAMTTGNVQVTGNLNISNDFVSNTMTALAFISAPSLFTSNLTPPGGGPLNTTTTLSTISGNLSVTGTIIGSGNVTGGNLLTAGSVSATGNINGGNLVAAANLTSTQQTIVGTANNGSTGNIVMSGKNIATDMAWLPDGGNAATAVNGRILVGTGWNGNNTHSAIQHRLFVNDSVQRSNTGTSVQLFGSDTQLSLIGNVTNGSFRQHAVSARVRVGGGSAGNTIALTSSGGGLLAAVAALQPNIEVGNVSPYLLGNTSVSHATLNGGFFTTQSGGFIGNAYGMLPGAIAATTGNANATGNITNYIGFSSSLAFSPYVTGNLYAFYHPNVASSADQTATGIGVANAARAATNYYAFRNDDPVAQVKLGSLRTYHEFQYSTATSGTVNIDKTNAQVQFLNPTANVTIGDLQNFVTTANDGTNNDSQTDTVTLIIQQGATPYTVTMPTGNAQIKYLGNVTTVGTTANAVTLVSIAAIRSAANAALYLATVTSEFV